MQYLITVKPTKSPIPARRELWNNKNILNFVRKVFVRNGSDENSADIQALALMQKVDDGEAQVMRNAKNGFVMVISLKVEK